MHAFARPAGMIAIIGGKSFNQVFKARTCLRNYWNASGRFRFLEDAAYRLLDYALLSRCFLRWLSIFLKNLDFFFLKKSVAGPVCMLLYQKWVSEPVWLRKTLGRSGFPSQGQLYGLRLSWSSIAPYTPLPFHLPIVIWCAEWKCARFQARLTRETGSHKPDSARLSPLLDVRLVCVAKLHIQAIVPSHVT